MLSRRHLLAGLFAAPAVVAIDSLMPLRGIKLNPIIRLQSWPFGTEAVGEWWAHEGPLSGIARIEEAMRDQMGRCFWQSVMPNRVRPGPVRLHTTPEDSILDMPVCEQSDSASRFGVAHGVPRNDLPLPLSPSPQEIARRVAYIRDFCVSPNGHRYWRYGCDGDAIDQHAKAYARSTEMLCAEHARIHRPPHGLSSSHTILRERVSNHLRQRETIRG